MNWEDFEKSRDSRLLYNMMPHTIMISHTGLLTLTFKSNLPEAIDFTRWIANEVVPIIFNINPQLTNKREIEKIFYKINKFSFLFHNGIRMSSLVLKDYFNYELNCHLTVYKNAEDELFFKAKEIAEILGYKNPQKAIRNHVREKYIMKLEDLQGVNDSFTPLREMNEQPHTIMISEPGFYALIIRSNLKSAEKFSEWVFEEAFPSIRKTGSYAIKGAISKLNSITDNDMVAVKLPEENRKTFRKESKIKSEMTKDPGAIERGSRGGKQLWENIRKMEMENEELIDENERLWDDIDTLQDHNYDLKDRADENYQYILRLQDELKELQKTLDENYQYIQHIEYKNKKLEEENKKYKDFEEE